MPVTLHQNGPLLSRIVIWTLRNYYETAISHFPLIHKMLQLGILGCEQALQGYRPAARVLQRACSQSKGILPAKPFFHLLSFDVLEKDSAHELSKIVVENALHAARIHF